MLITIAFAALFAVPVPRADWVQESGSGAPTSELAGRFDTLLTYFGTQDALVLGKKLGVQASVLRTPGRIEWRVAGARPPRAHAQLLALEQPCTVLPKRLGSPTQMDSTGVIYRFVHDATRGRLAYLCDAKGNVGEVVVTVTLFGRSPAIAGESPVVPPSSPFGDDESPATLRLTSTLGPDFCRGSGTFAADPTVVVAATNAARAAQLIAPWGIDPRDAATAIDKLGPPTRCTATQIEYPGITWSVSDTRIFRLRIDREALPFLTQRGLDHALGTLIDMTSAQVDAHFGGTTRHIVAQRGWLYAKLQSYFEGPERWTFVDVTFGTTGLTLDGLPGLDLARWPQTLKSLGELPPGVAISGDTLVVETRAKRWLTERGSGGALLATALGSTYLQLENLLGPPAITDIRSPPERDVRWVRVPNSNEPTATIRLRCGPAPAHCHRLEIRGDDGVVTDGK